MTVANGDLISVATLIIGFGVTVFMFRVQRELWVQEHHPDWPNWLAWADYLMVGSVALAIAGVIVPILLLPAPDVETQAVAAAACVAAAVLQAGYIPGILSHYRIEIGRGRKGDRLKGEPMERRIVYTSVALALIAFIATRCRHLRAA